MQVPQTSTIRMIAIDMDGTLLGEDGQVSPRNLTALLAAQTAGVEILIATGRRHSYAMRILRPLGLLPNGALISSNGTVTRTLGSFGADPVSSQLIARTHMPHATALWLCGHLRGIGEQDFRNTLVLTFDRVGPDGDDTRGALVVEELDQLHASIGRWMTSNEPYIAHINPIEQALLPGAEHDASDATDEPSHSSDSHRNAPIQAMLCGTIEHMARAEARLLEHPGVQPSDQVPGAPSFTASSGLEGFQNHTGPEHILTLHRTVYPSRNLAILDILPPNCSKGAAILTYAASRNVQPSEILAIGDNWNDVSMLDIAGQSVLMANAPEDLQALARTRNWRIGLANTADGVAEAIDSALTVTCA